MATPSLNSDRAFSECALVAYVSARFEVQVPNDVDGSSATTLTAPTSNANFANLIVASLKMKSEVYLLSSVIKGICITPMSNIH